MTRLCLPARLKSVIEKETEGKDYIGATTYTTEQGDTERDIGL